MPTSALLPVATALPSPSPSLPESQLDLIECGEASYYGFEFQGSSTANGEAFDTLGLTAAHKTLPFGTRVRVLKKGESPSQKPNGVSVRINDRGPFVPGRIIDLSLAAFEKLAPQSRGTLDVCLYRESSSSILPLLPGQ